MSQLEQLKNGAKLLIYERVKIRIGKPMEFPEYYDEEPDKDILYDIASRVRNVILNMYNEEFEKK